MGRAGRSGTGGEGTGQQRRRRRGGATDPGRGARWERNARRAARSKRGSARGPNCLPAGTARRSDGRALRRRHGGRGLRWQGAPRPAAGGRSPRWAGLRGVRLPAEPGAAAEAAVGSKGGRAPPPPVPALCGGRASPVVGTGVVPRRPGKRLGEGGWRSPGALPGRIRARRWESRLSAVRAWFPSGKGGRFPLRSGGWGKGELPATPLGGSDLPASRRPALKGPNPAQHRQPFWAACSCLCQLQGFKEAVRKAAGLLAA